MEMKIHEMRNNCSLVALQEMSGKADAEIFAAVRKHGYRDNRGMYTEHYHRAAVDLGLELGPERYWFDLTKVEGRVSSALTVRKVVKMFPAGAFFVKTNRHVMVVRDGVVRDPNWGRRAGMARKVYSVTEVRNPHVPVVRGLVALARPHVRRRTLAARERWFRVVHFLSTAGACAPERLLHETGYPKRDFEWDLKRGNLKIV